MKEKISQLAQLIIEREELEQRVILHYEKVIKRQECIINDLRMKLASVKVS